MSVKYTTQRAPIQGGPEFEKISDELSADLFKADKDLKDRVDGLIQGRLQVGQLFLQELAKVLPSPSKQAEAIRDVEGKTKAQMNEYFNQMNVRLGAAGLDLDHMDITYVNTRTALLINLLQGEIDRQKETMSNQAPDKETETMLRSIAPAMRREGGGTPALEKIVTDLRKNLAISERLAARIDKQGSFSDVDYDAVIADLEAEGEVELDKEKYVNALDGKAEGTFRYTSRTFNRTTKGNRQLVAAAARQATISRSGKIGGGLGSAIEKEGEKFMERIAKSSFQVTGSKSIEEGLVAQLEANFLKRKAKIQSDKRRIKKTGKKRVSKSRKAKAAFDFSLAEGARKLKAIQARAAVGTKTKRDDPDSQRALNALRLTINAKLSEKVKQNMGRPALENRSGQFAESVRLETLTSARGAKTITGQYSYQYSPYETFENASRWPAGYNPKPLISKSIREVATKQLAAKFTLRKL